ncbi:putative glycerol-3-phosphate acyltransferase 3 [Panicum miliaceum]|uniref:Glycerol-3-phosphate acyltransferase 3 n=1 Tax=Panicum miliaceum TaxID=4540 RepID=A0A3L6SYM6_PANMI|nr:putative glycerol-3-phosphate acyltransferase 3 [Panicum miliaceum]
MAKKMLPAAANELLSALLHTGTTAPGRSPRAARSSPAVHRCAPPAARLAGAGTTLVVDVDGALLLPRRSLSFAYFMLVALEAGSFLRGLALLLLYPAIALLGALGGRDMAVRAMAAVAFCGLRVGTFRAGRAVLPRWLLEDVAAEALEAARRAGDPARVVWASAMPRVMVEPFLREYLQVPAAAAVAAREVKTAWGFYTGLMECREATSSALRKNAAAGGGDGDVVGFSAGGSMAEFLRSPLASICKELYVPSPEEQSKWRRLPRRDYPNPLVFHDGRLAFLPTPLAAVAMFMWLPLGAVLSVARLAVAMVLPYRYATALLAATGQSWRLRGALPPDSRGASGQLYACNHRTLIDPVYVSIALDRQVRAVSYSLSRLSDMLSPIGRTVHLARDRARDGAAMARLLGRGDSVVVCPEGTTCREPYLLRFSPLFAELGGERGVVPVALAVENSMFYGTTASGWKGVDPFYYLSNPRMCYTVEFLDRVDTAAVGEGKAASTDVANSVQRLIAAALGYECTMLTRKDKYLMLVGNDGAVAAAAPPRRQVR